MTVDQVDAIMKRWTIDPFPTDLDGLVPREGEDFILYRPGAEAGRFQNDYGLVRFRNGQVESVRFGQY